MEGSFGNIYLTNNLKDFYRFATTNLHKEIADRIMRKKNDYTQELKLFFVVSFDILASNKPLGTSLKYVPVFCDVIAHLFVIAQSRW